MGVKIGKSKRIVTIGAGILLSIILIGVVVKGAFYFQEGEQVRNNLVGLTSEQETKIASLSARITELESEDLRKTNESIKATVSAVNTTFDLYAELLDKVADARVLKIDIAKQEAELPKIVRLLADLKWSEAKTKIAEVQVVIEKSISDQQAKVAATLPAAPESQSLPAGDGYSRQTVKTDAGSFTVTLIASTLGSTRILTDTVGEGDCNEQTCSTKPLADYVSANGGFAGINGAYFCPPDYAQCAGKAGSFGTLVFNSRLKKYINSENNKFSTVPMFVQTGDRGMRFMGQTVEWGRDTGIVGGLANYPLLVSGGQPATSDGGGGGGRNFIGVKSGKVYIGHVHGANFANAAKVLSTLGMENALNLDTGGSTAIYFNGKYIMGPGRLLPNAIILAR